MTLTIPSQSYFSLLIAQSVLDSSCMLARFANISLTTLGLFKAVARFGAFWSMIAIDHIVLDASCGVLPTILLTTDLRLIAEDRLGTGQLMVAMPHKVLAISWALPSLTIISTFLPFSSSLPQTSSSSPIAARLHTMLLTSCGLPRSNTLRATEGWVTVEIKGWVGEDRRAREYMQLLMAWGLPSFIILYLLSSRHWSITELDTPITPNAWNTFAIDCTVSQS
mmetsp:Transcript_8420/g.17024  ORF Transcript_8420/g.17024 Transcript_8420/m.17024 type:complete len:223 (+) Transcript_8420:818-1486(+)